MSEFVCKKEKKGVSKKTFTVGDVSFTMIFINGGTYIMGATENQTSDFDDDYDEVPIHQVILSDYYIGETEVTQALWVAVMGDNPSQFKGKDNPVENVSYDMCIEFIDKFNLIINRKLGGMRFALPTEAQWEFAARGGNKSCGYKYSGSNILDDIAWYEENSGSTTHPVAQKQSNELGLYDMSGNVYEWCRDWYGDYLPYSQTDPTGPIKPDIFMYRAGRICRGGSFTDNSSKCRVSYRDDAGPSWYSYDIGFRLALVK